MIRIHKEFNIETGEETIIEREETKEEKAERLAFEKELAIKTAEEAEKVSARAAILDKLGLTSEEASALLG